MSDETTTDLRNWPVDELLTALPVVVAALEEHKAATAAARQAQHRLVLELRQRGVPWKKLADLCRCTSSSLQVKTSRFKGKQ